MKQLAPGSAILTPDELEALGNKIMGMTTADTVNIDIAHTATGVARVAQNRILTNNDGNDIRLDISTQFGRRVGASIGWDRIDDQSLRDAVTYLERIAKEMPGDPIKLPIPEVPLKYLPGTVWHDSTMTAMSDARNAILPGMINGLRDAKLTGSIFVGVIARSQLSMSKSGRHIAGHETDAELVVSGWTPSGTGLGWAGKATRDWADMQPDAVVAEAIRLANMDDNPVAVEPGRSTVILARPAMAQFARQMAYAWNARDTIIYHSTPFWDPETAQPKLDKRVFDERIKITVDPNDPEGGYLPFQGTSPLVPMTFVDQGILKHLAFDRGLATQFGISPANGDPDSMRLEGIGPLQTEEEMIASCERGFYVNRVANLGVRDGLSGVMSGVTMGGVFLIEKGRITKPVKNFQFVDSPFIFLNNLISIGASKRTAFGYSPWAGGWPIPPSVVPPVMVRDFNFVRLSDAV